MWAIAGFLMCPEWPASYIYPVLPLTDANFEGGSGKSDNEIQTDTVMKK